MDLTTASTPFSPTLTLAEIPPILLGLLVVVFVFVSVALVLVVLIQRPQGGGLSGAFGAGGQGSGQTVFGAKTGDALTIATITVFVVWLLVAVGLNWAVSPPTPQAQPTAESIPEAPAGAEAPTGEAASEAVEGEAVTPGEGESFVTDPLDAETGAETGAGEGGEGGGSGG
jgi:preprotein translocase subunit SecG